MNNETIARFTEAIAADPELQKEVQSVQQAAARETAEKLAALSNPGSCWDGDRPRV